MAIRSNPTKRAANKRPRALNQVAGLANTISERLPQARKNHLPPLTQDKLAEEVEQVFGIPMDRAMIGKIEIQQRGVYDYEVAAFAHVLGVSADWLLGLTDDLETIPERRPPKKM